MDINWPEVTAGFTLGLTPLVARQLYGAFRYAKIPGRRKYLGLWWFYHRSTTGSGRVYERQWSIKYSWLLNTTTIRAFEPTDISQKHKGAALTYIGKMSPRQGMVRYVNVRDPASHEQIAWYLFDPFPDPAQRTVGLYLALDMRGLPAAGPLLVSKERIDIAEAERLLPQEVIRIAPMLNTAEIALSHDFEHRDPVDPDPPN